MLEAFSGRIDRKTYVVGNLLALLVLGVFTAIIVLPLAILDLAINAKLFDETVSILNYAVIFPALLYFFYFAVLMVKRAHDIGWPGLMILFGFILLVILGRVTDFYLFNVIAILVVGAFCAKPGMNRRNQFGPKPRKKLKAENLKVTF